MKIRPIGRGWQHVLSVAFLIIVACTNPVAHIPEINPEQLRARPVKDPPPTEQTYKMVPYDLITVRFTYHPEQDPKDTNGHSSGRTNYSGRDRLRSSCGSDSRRVRQGDCGEELYAPEKSRGRCSRYPICTEKNICRRTGKSTRHRSIPRGNYPAPGDS